MTIPKATPKWHVFEKPENHIHLTEFKKKLILPNPTLLLSTKLKSLPNRDKEDKKKKDICDIVALLLYATTRIAGNELLQFLPREQVLKSIDQISDQEMQTTDYALGLQKNQAKTAILNLKKQLNNQ